MVAGATEIDINAGILQHCGNSMPPMEAATMWGGVGVVMEDEAQKRNIAGDREAILLLSNFGRPGCSASKVGLRRRSGRWLIR